MSMPLITPFVAPTSFGAVPWPTATVRGCWWVLHGVVSAILVVVVWKYLGFHMILYIAGLQGVSKDLEDAAVVDGASKLQVVRHVIIPSIRNTIVISVFLSVIGSLNIFDVVWALGQGGPVHSTETLVTYLYNFGFRRFAFGYGSAVAVVIFLLSFAFNFLYQRFIVREQTNG